ncbi:hypothetical protein Godav_028730 [Gossypium davidsonii]|uniref:Uncharacterized protein n=1 Tax=Gossypium davidsonii TaxID=34287 RepID=A0A7J8S0W8_GOSDV|nr:hypothetical protein [Gossypium davidsonii]
MAAISNVGDQFSSTLSVQEPIITTPQHYVHLNQQPSSPDAAPPFQMLPIIDPIQSQRNSELDCVAFVTRTGLPSKAQNPRAGIVFNFPILMICRECFYAVIEEEIHQVILENQLLEPGERIATGASGGKGLISLYKLI